MVFEFLSLIWAVLWTHLYRLRVLYSCIAVLVGILGVLWWFFCSAPAEFPRNVPVVLSSGDTLKEVAETLHEKHVIRSEEVFILTTKLLSDDRNIQAGSYVFSKPYSIFSIEHRIANGISDILLTRVTFVEGATAKDMAEQLKSKLPGFDSEAFETLATPYEGYLFPDTYRFLPTATPEDVVGILRTTFDKKTRAISAQIAASSHTLHDIVTMASILEREGRTLEEKQMIAGILWKRVDENMPLQVDAVFGYIKGRDTYSPSFSDLKIDSPYNTYRNKGLPPGPISNPGLDSLLAAATPTKNDYWYYLTGRDGKMYYAKTFEEHKQNRAKYLD